MLIITVARNKTVIIRELEELGDWKVPPPVLVMASEGLLSQTARSVKYRLRYEGEIAAFYEEVTK